jgi:glycerol-3-phosphate O-acyltransferase
MTVTLPLWLLILIVAFAAIAALDRVLVPSVRWFFRRRVERVVARVNTRLERKIEPFKLARRQDMIVRLAYDPRVMEAVTEHAAETGVPLSVAFEEALGYAREIVPAFSATLYFGYAIRAARSVSRAFYRVRVGRVDAALAHIDPKATIIFVMNHRSNMDYVLVTWLVAGRAAISYAVGEWARVWPLSAMIRAMGAYFIRRNSRNPLYRRVLARYVQMATAGGTTQAIFPEGGLSVDGQVGPAKMGLLSYIVQGFDPAGRDVVFVPVGLAYDRILEDRVLVAAHAEGTRKFKSQPLKAGTFLLRTLWRKFRGRFKGFGTAAAAFGAPISLRAFMAQDGATTETLGVRLMADIAAVVPVLPVPLVAAVLMRGGATRDALPGQLQQLMDALTAQGAVLRLPPQGMEQLLAEGLEPLIARGMVREGPEGLTVADAGMVGFYAASLHGNAATPQT